MTARDPVKWDARFMALAEVAATWSEDPNKKVGAVVVSPDGRQFSIGYNGLPRDFKEKLEQTGMLLDRDLKNRYSLHAETNALANAPVDVLGWWMYVTEAPCLDCALSIHRAGIARVVSAPIDPSSSWASTQQEAEGFLASMGVGQVRMRNA